MFFARRLGEAGYHLGPVVVNRIHPPTPAAPATPRDTASGTARRLLEWLGERDRRGLAQLRQLLPSRPVVGVPLLPRAPTDLDALAELGQRLVGESV